MRVLLCCLRLLSGLSDAQATCRVDLRAWKSPLEVVGGSLLVKAEVTASRRRSFSIRVPNARW